ncbi:MAG TPA: twin-arginine translocase TatA/TatE family subunit [Candidatus Limnocylindrales bacterium]|nr:twin-arginine translocase TatA/TatE family subunit [Candidatus Limnocylindrales bacterium]
MPFNFGPGELIILLIIALVVIGPGKLPEVGAALGKSIREFRRASTDVKEAVTVEPPARAEPPKPAAVEPPQPAPPPVNPPSGEGPTSAAPSPAEPVAVAPGASDPDSPAS